MCGSSPYKTLYVRARTLTILNRNKTLQVLEMRAVYYKSVKGTCEFNFNNYKH